MTSNVQIKAEGGVVVITIMPSGGTISKSGKSKVIATTSGFVTVPGTDYKLGLNLIAPK